MSFRKYKEEECSDGKQRLNRIVFRQQQKTESDRAIIIMTDM